MKKIVALLLTIALCLGCTAALAAGKLDVVQENFIVIPSYSTYAYAYAKVENIGDKPISVNAGVLEVYNEDGDAITSADYLYAGAEVLQPGEYTYTRMYAEIEEGDVADDYALTLTGKAEKDKEFIRLDCVPDLQLNVEDGWWVHNYMYATVTNNTDEPMYSVAVVMALLDAEGNILYIEDDNLYSDRALAPGSTLIFRTDIPSNFIEVFNAEGLVPASVDAIAYVEVDK